jgi:2-oxo-4-hydroxy-4-carboxy-5-ureidoimidazoline decarboxylase
MSLEQINAAESDAASYLFRQCCSSESWIERMIAGRPYASRQALLDAADTQWQSLTEADFLQAFDGHPKIGDVSSLKARYANTKTLAAGEQAGVGAADASVIEELARGNQAYQDKFGFIFIVCATGKSAQEMSDLLQARLKNDRATEIENAAEEQRKIFQLRLRQLLVSQ